MRLSIIIPVYNTESFLLRCLSSCLDQDIPEEDYEIVVINDGSTDGSLSVVQEFATIHPNVRIISQENGGLSRARNSGLREAAGDYVWLVDSDDYIACDCLGMLLERCVRDALDVVGMGRYRRMPDGSVSERPLYSRKQSQIIYDGPSAMRSGLFKAPCAPFYVIRRSFLLENSLFFMDGVLHEDEEFTPRMFYLARRISFVDNCFYYACLRVGSIMQTPNPKRAFDLLKIARRLDTFSRESVLKRDRYLFSLQISNVTDSCLKLCQSMQEDTVTAINAQLSDERWIANHFIKSRNLKFIFSGLLFRLFPKRMVAIYSLLLRIAKRNR